MDIHKIVKMYNEDSMTLEQIGKEFGRSKTTLSRALKKEGWNFDRISKKYVHETINTGNSKEVNNVSNKTIDTVKCTFDLPLELATALKVKSSVERVKMVKIVEKALRGVIEDKYFNI